jgi:hypothetical protein
MTMPIEEPLLRREKRFFSARRSIASQLREEAVCNAANSLFATLQRDALQPCKAMLSRTGNHLS